MRRLWPAGIRGRLLTLVVFAVVPVFVVGMGTSIAIAIREDRTLEVQKASRELGRMVGALGEASKAVRSDVVFLASVPPVRGLIRARANGKIDPVDGSTEAHWLGRMRILFTAFGKTRPSTTNCGFSIAPARGLRMSTSQTDDGSEAPIRLGRASAIVRSSPGGRARPGSDLCLAARPREAERADSGTAHGCGRHRRSRDRRCGPCPGRCRGACSLRRLAGGRVQDTRAGDAGTDRRRPVGFYLYHDTSREKTWGGPLDLNTGEGAKKDFAEYWPAILSAKAGATTTRDGIVVTDVCHLERADSHS